MPPGNHDLIIMAIDQFELRQAAGRNFSTRQTGRAYGQKTAFLCHSHKDQQLAIGLQQRLKEEGLNLYIDWQDASMPEEPNRETAENIQSIIRGSEIFLFLATQNSMSSRWCPWEIGYADGVKNINQIAIIPTRDAIGHYYGNEYLQLYRRIDKIANSGPIYWFNKNSSLPFNIYSF